MKTVQFEYKLGDKVRLIYLDHAVGFIIGLHFQDVGIEYEIVYYIDGRREQGIFFPQEIDIVSPARVGFTNGNL
jgi:hypothetical protein